MADRRISVRDRVKVIEDIEGTANYLNSIAARLGEHDLEVEANAVDDAAKSLLAAWWWLSRPLRPQMPPQRWQQPTCREGMSVPGADLR